MYHYHFHSRLLLFCGKAVNVCTMLGCRLMVGQWFLVPYVWVRLLPPQPLDAYVLDG